MDWIKNISKRKDRESLSSPTKGAFLSVELASESLNGGLNLAELVQLPNGLDLNEWLAYNTVSFFDHTSLLFSCVAPSCSSQCSQQASPNTTGPSLTYTWVDEKGKKVKCNPSQYMDLALSFAQRSVEDEAVFPTKYGNTFPSNFMAIVRKVHSRLLQVLSHIYLCHATDVTNFTLQACLNTTYHHFRLFNDHFQLVDDKENEVLEPLFRVLQHNMQQRLLQLQHEQQLQQHSSSFPSSPSSSSFPASSSSLPSLHHPLHPSTLPASSLKHSKASSRSRLLSYITPTKSYSPNQSNDTPPCDTSFRPLSIAT